MQTKRISGYAERTRDYRETVRQLEYAYAALSAFFPKAAVGKVEVLFLPGASFTDEFGAERSGLVLPVVPAAGRLGRQNLIVMTEGVDNSYALSLLTHLFVHKAVPGAPLWLHQGLSRYFSSTALQSGNGQWRACFGLLAPLDARFFQMPLDKFFAITWQQYPEASGFYLGTARLLMDFIFHADQGAHLGKLPAIFAAASRGVPGPEIMAAAFPGLTLAQLGERISGFKGSRVEQLERGILCPLPVPIEPGQIPDESDPQESPIASQEIEQLLAALHKLPHGDRFPAWYPPDVIGVPSAGSPP